MTVRLSVDCIAGHSVFVSKVLGRAASFWLGVADPVDRLLSARIRIAPVQGDVDLARQGCGPDPRPRLATTPALSP